MNVPIHTTPAHLWDGHRQLPGTLELWEHKVVFQFDNFKESHLTLVIPVWEILRVETFLLFDLTCNGVRIENKKGHVDAFIVDDAIDLKRRLLALKDQGKSG